MVFLLNYRAYVGWQLAIDSDYRFTARSFRCLPSFIFICGVLKKIGVNT